MAEMTIRLQIDPAPGKNDIIASLRSDAAALPQEHEQQHRDLADKLIEGGVVKSGEVGNIVVEREEEPAISEPMESLPQREAQFEGQ